MAAIVRSALMISIPYCDKGRGSGRSPAEPLEARYPRRIV